jgi:Zn-dependent protease
MFIPGFGAFISLYDSPANVGQDARIGLAGPMWGASAALAFLIPSFLLPNAGLWMALARATALINLFNLTPVWTLDGSRGFRALDRRQRLYLITLLTVMWLLTQEGLFLLPILGTAYRLFWNKDFAPEPDWTAFFQFAILAALFGALLAGIAIQQ